MNADDIISNAQRAKQFISNADVDPLPDELLIRASVAFSMLVRQGVIVGPLDDMDLPHAISNIAANFAASTEDETPHRVALFATKLDDAS